MAKRRANGEGSVFYRKDRKRWVYEYTVEGKKASTSAKTQKELLAKKEEIDKRILKSKYIFNDNTTLLELLEYNLKVKYDLNLISNTTYIRNKETIKILEPIYNIPIQKITEDMIISFYRDLSKKYSDSTIQKAIFLLKGGFMLAKEKNIIYKNIIENIKKPKSTKETKKVEGLTIEEQKALLKIIYTSKYYLIYLIALNTGMRMRRNISTS